MNTKSAITFALLILAMLACASCRGEPDSAADAVPQQAATAPPTATRELTATPTVTHTPPSATATPSPIPSATPTATPLPFPEEPVTRDNAHLVTKLRTLGRGTVHDFGLSPDGETLAFAASSGLYLYDAGSLEEIGLVLPGSTTDVVYSPDGKLIAASQFANGEGSVRVLRTADYFEVIQVPIREIIGEFVMMDHIALGPDGRMLAVREQKTVHIWNLETGEEERVLEPARANLAESDVSLAFSPGGRWLASAHTRSTAVTVWDVENDYERFQIETETLSVTPGPMVFAPDDQWLAIGFGAGLGDQAAVEVWNMETRSLTHTLSGYPGSITALTLSADGRLLATASDDGLRLWDMERGQLVDHWQIEGGMGFHAIAFTADGEQLFTSSGKDDGLIVWAVATGERVGAINDFTTQIIGKTLLPDNRTVAVKLYGGVIELWDLVTGEEKQAFHHGGSAWGGIAVSPDGRLLASGAGEEIVVWSVDSGETIAQFPVGDGYVTDLLFSPDGRFLLSFADEHRNSPIILWNTVSWTKAREYRPSNVEVLSYSSAEFDFTPDSRMLVAGLGGALGTRLMLWNVEQGSGPVILFDDTSPSMRDVAFTPDGKLLGLLYQEEARDGTFFEQFSLWDYVNREEVARIQFDSDLYEYDFDIVSTRDGQYFQIQDVTGNVAYLAGNIRASQFNTSFTNDGQIFLIPDLIENAVHLVDIASKELLEAQTITGLWLLVSPDGRLIVTDDTWRGQITVWGIPPGR